MRTWESPMLGQKCAQQTILYWALYRLGDLQQREIFSWSGLPFHTETTHAYLTGAVCLSVHLLCQCSTLPLVFCELLLPNLHVGLHHHLLCSVPQEVWGGFTDGRPEGLMFALSVQSVPCENQCKLSLLLLFRIDNTGRWRRFCFIVSSLELAVPQNRQYLRTGCCTSLSFLAINCEGLSYSCNHNTCKKKIPSHVLP